MKRWSKYSWGSDETKLISAILDAAKNWEASQEVAEDGSSEDFAPEKSAPAAKELQSSGTSAR